MTRLRQSARKLHNGHFAFMRALAQGLDERASWDRYLRLEGEHTDLRTVRRTVAWIRDEFAAAARREQRPGTARLILLDPSRIPNAPALPTLAEFAEAQGLEDFSESEQIEAYEARYPGAEQGAGAGGTSRRARLIERQLEALQWLQGLVARDPRLGDSVGAWLNPVLAQRLERAGVPTLAALAERINGIGARWWVHVPGVGEIKAGRIVQWLQAHEAALGLRVGAHVLKPRSQLPAAALAAVVPATTALVPFEKFVLPAALDGRAGEFRAPRAACRLMAVNDHEAVGAWIAAAGSEPAKGPLSSTGRAYRKEAERLLLWAILVRGKALSSLSSEDATAYREFLRNAPAAWCGPRHHQRWSPLWRPLEGPLAPAALGQALVVLRGLFGFLVRRGYLVANPFSAVAMLEGPRRAPGLNRTLNAVQWARLETLLQDDGRTEAARRLRRAAHWIRATGLSVAEITAAKCGDLERLDGSAGPGLQPATWILHVPGRRGRHRAIPVPLERIDELGEELTRHGFERQVDASGNHRIPILARFDAGFEQPPPWSASGLYQAIKELLARTAAGLDGPEAQRWKRASPLWLRPARTAGDDSTAC